MKKARWLLEHFSSEELNGLKTELKELLSSAREDSFPLLQELLEKIHINSHSRYLNREFKAWRHWAKRTVK